MKILHITPHYFPYFGGVEEVVRNYSEHLVSDHQAAVTVLTVGDKGSGSDEELNGVKVKRIANVPDFLTQIDQIHRFPRAMKAVSGVLSEDFDLVHIHANKRFITDVAAMVLSTRKKPFVFSPHAGQFGTSLMGRIHNQTIGRLAFKARHTIVVSEFEKKLLAKNGFTKNVTVLPNGIDLDSYKTNNETYLNHFDVENKTKVLFVGRFARSKGVDLLPAIAAEVVKTRPEVLFILVGHDEGAKASLTADIKQRSLEKQFLILEDLERENLISIYKNADLFIFPSRSEAFGVAVVEAMSAGLPIVASENTAIPELIRDGENGLLAQTDSVENFAAKLIQLINVPQEATRLGDQAKKDSAHYDWRVIVDRLYKLYEEVLQ